MAVNKDNNKWKVDVSDGFDHLTGQRKRIRKTGFNTKKEADDYEAQARLYELNQIKPQDSLSIEYLYSLVKEEDDNRGNSQATRDGQESIYRIYVSQFFKDANMRLVKASDVKKFRKWIQSIPSVNGGGRRSNGNINRQMIFLHKMFDVAITNDLRTDNPCQALRALPEKHKEMDYYTPEEFKRFVTLINPVTEFCFLLLYKILMFTGARLGEALAMTWKSVNLKEGYIDITTAAHYRKKKVTIGATKTTQSVRRIYIHKDFVNELKDWKEKQSKLLRKYTDDIENLQVIQTTPNIVTSPNVANFKHDKLNKRMPADLKTIRNHDFRHSHAAFLISIGLRKGESKDFIFFTLMKRLGHSSINTTINTYSHLFPAQQKEIANAFDDF